MTCQMTKLSQNKSKKKDFFKIVFLYADHRKFSIHSTTHNPIKPLYPNIYWMFASLLIEITILTQRKALTNPHGQESVWSFPPTSMGISNQSARFGLMIFRALAKYCRRGSNVTCDDGWRCSLNLLYEYNSVFDWQLEQRQTWGNRK